MELTEFTFRLLLLFLPGVITRMVVEQLTVVEDKRHLYFLLNALVYGFFAYFVYGLLLQCLTALGCVKLNASVSFLESLVKKDSQLNFTEILLVSGLSVIKGLFFSFLINNKLFHHFASAIGVTRKFADIDVWGYLHNSQIDELLWVTVRDHASNLVFEGRVEAFSDTVKDNELFLRDVIVYRNSTGEELYRVPGVYLSRKSDDITIEYNALGFTELIERPNPQTSEGGNNG